MPHLLFIRIVFLHILIKYHNFGWVMTPASQWCHVLAESSPNEAEWIMSRWGNFETVSGWILYLKPVSSTNVSKGTSLKVTSTLPTLQPPVRPDYVFLVYVAWLLFLFSVALLTLLLYTVQKVHIKVSAAMIYQWGWRKNQHSGHWKWCVVMFGATVFNIGSHWAP